MRTFLDKDISSAKTLWDALLLFFGFGIIHARLGCIKLGLIKNISLKKITNKELNSLDKHYRQKNFLVGRVLERELYIKTSALIEINAYRAIRAKQGLPNRGQRTHTNAKTARKLSGLWAATSNQKNLKNAANKKGNDPKNLLKRKNSLLNRNPFIKKSKGTLQKKKIHLK